MLPLQLLRLLKQVGEPLDHWEYFLGQDFDLDRWAGFGQALDSLKINKLKASSPNPIMESAIVGVKTPESETCGSRVAVGVADPDGVTIGVPDGVGEGEVFGVEVGDAVVVAEGVDSKAGPSAA